MRVCRLPQTPDRRRTQNSTIARTPMETPVIAKSDAANFCMMSSVRRRHLAGKGTCKFRPASEQALHEGDVQPAAELAPDFALDADQLEPACGVEPDGGL